MAQMALSSGIMVDIEAVHYSIKRLINQMYKLLPIREQGKDWEKPLETLIEEVNGMKKLIIGQDQLFLLLLCKMEGLFSLKDNKNMILYRRTVFECLNLLNNLEKHVCNQ